MDNLFWKRKTGTPLNLVESEFSSEAEFEDYIYRNQRDFLDGIYIFSRQVRTGSKRGIPDLIGVDQDGAIIIIELKNVEVTEDVLPQVLGYAIWAETNPDSIKALWLEQKDQPEELLPNWENPDVRVLVIGPSFRTTVVRMAAKIGYRLDLLQFTRFQHEDDDFILLASVEEAESPRPRHTSAKAQYDEAYYRENHGDEATTAFLARVREVEGLAEKNKWQLRVKLNKYYAGFMYGNAICFTVNWGGTKVHKVSIRIPKEVAEEVTLTHWELQRFDQSFKESVFRYTSPQAHASELESLFMKRYQDLTGVT